MATPIGNSEDITDRAKRILSEVDIIAAEDTRTTAKLLTLLGIKNKTISNHKFNERSQAEHLIAKLVSGEDVAIVSDAGTPCISDPGHVLVRAAVEHGIDVVGISGASAVVTALSVSAFDFTAFSFYGFLPRKSKELRELFTEIRQSDVEVTVHFESPHRIVDTLCIISEELPNAAICLCNDLTKLFERIYRGTPSEVIAELEANPSAHKGEYTLVLYSGKRAEIPADNPHGAKSPEAMLVDCMVEQGMTLKEAIDECKRTTDISKKELYNASLRLKDMFG